jgi:hypothetical protein
MHLLAYNEDDTISIKSFDDEPAPPYAILSHTWGPDNEEVTFADIVNDDGWGKAGYEKIRFCGAQARRDGLRYFWVDTCCINKTKEAEYAFSIRSMFRWYRNAERCYVYLSDVTSVSSVAKKDSHDFGCFDSEDPSRPSEHHNKLRECQRRQLELSESRWFTRGWTLQELLAPSKVEFFTKEGTKLGDKLSLLSDLARITGIPRSALQGTPLSNFSVQKRIEWSEHRKTTTLVDRAYSLMGILGVSLSPIDEESQAEAMRRVRHEIDKQNKCVQDLRSTNPYDDKKRIQATKGGLLVDSYHWVFDNKTFQQWQQDLDSRLLWIKGDPGKGKTMLLCGIIDEIQKTTRHNDTVAYFFCQATDSRINNAVAVLRGLLYMLVLQQPLLASHIQKLHEHAGKQLFEDANAWVALRDVFTEILQDPSLGKTCLVVDALDECITDLPKLLNLVAEQSSTSSRVKWIVSSRNWPDIETRLERAGHKVKLSLELNSNSVATAVDAFIQQKVVDLAQKNDYKAELQSDVLRYLRSNADNTFLWVALVCQDLQDTEIWLVQKKLASIPSGLSDLYTHMLYQMCNSDSADICQQVLTSVAVFYRPVTTTELLSLVQTVADLVDDTKVVRKIIGYCKSFLTIRNDTIYFVHQSAKDFLVTQAAGQIFPVGVEAVHHTVFLRSLTRLSSILHRDMYKLKAPATASKEITVSDHDPLAPVHYLCTHWADHFCDSSNYLSADCAEQLALISGLDHFFRKTYLYWIEALSLCKSVEQGITAVAKVLQVVQVGLRPTTYSQCANKTRIFKVRVSLLHLFMTRGGSSCITRI